MYTRPPGPPYVMNRDSPQARGLAAWWPLGEANPAGYQDYAAGKYPLVQAGGVTVAAGPDGGLAPSFAAASSQKLNVAAATAAAVPLSLTCWFNATDLAANYAALCVTQAAGNTHGWVMRLVATTANVAADTHSGATTGTASTTAAYAAGVWNHGAVVFASATDRRAFLNGGNKATNATSVVPNAPDVTGVGYRDRSTDDRFMNGRLADARVYAVDLSDSEVAALYDPRSRWELYYPLGRKTFSFAPAAAAGANRHHLLLLGCGA